MYLLASVIDGGACAEWKTIIEEEKRKQILDYVHYPWSGSNQVEGSHTSKPWEWPRWLLQIDSSLHSARARTPSSPPSNIQLRLVQISPGKETLHRARGMITSTSSIPV